MLFIPVSYSNALIVSVISATATDVRTSKPHWNAVFLYVHRRKCQVTRSGLTISKSGTDTKKARHFCLAFGALLGTRTLDPLIKSQLLYQLS